MAEFALGLAKMAVAGTVSRVKSAIEEDARLRVRVEHDLMFITGEFEMMQSFLNAAKKERTNNHVVRTWVRQIRDLAFDVEDCIEFVVHLDKPMTCDWVRRMTSSLFCIPRQPLPLDVAVAEIKQLKVRVKNVSQRNTRYNLIGTADNDDDSFGSRPSLVSPAAAAADTAASAFHTLSELWEATGKMLPDIAQADFKKLIDCEGSSLQVISLWGNDLGRMTSMTRKAYDDPEICQIFKNRAWVKLMHPFNPDELLKALFTQFYPAKAHRADDIKKTKLMYRVSKRRYLVVIEQQVSSVEDWDTIRMYLQDSHKGSRIVLSTQQLGIALLCTGEPYQVSKITHTQLRYLHSQPIRAILNKGSGHHSGIGEFIRLLRRRGVISVWGPDCEEIWIPAICRGRMDKSKVFDGVNFDHYVEFSVPDCQDLLTDLALELCKSSYPEDQQEEEGERLYAMELSDIIESWRKLLTESDGSHLILIVGLDSTDEWDLIKANILFEPTKLCIVVRTEDENLAKYCVGYEYRALSFEDMKDSQQNIEHGGKRKEDAGKWIEDMEPKLVSRSDEVNLLGRCLVSHAVISVWGISGVGKSVIVRNCYYRKLLGANFAMYGWVDAPHPLTLTDFCRRLLLDFHSDDLQAKEVALVGMMEGQDPIQRCRKIMREKKCLLVIDGLESTHDWDMIKSTLLFQHTESRIVIVTNEETVATHCTDSPDGKVNIKCLESDAALDLFKNVTNHELPSGYESFVSKCGGLPKVIVAIGEFLKKSRYGIKYIDDDFMGVLEKNPIFYSLKGLFFSMRTYFDACPDYLKPCIFYLSVFPGGQSIRRRRLLRRWIAEGYCKDTFGSTAEEDGEKLFSELVKLSIIHKETEESQASCQVNGFFREYIISRPMDDNLVFALEEWCSPNSRPSGKHLTIWKDWVRDENVFKSLDLFRLRSLTVFGQWESFFMSNKMRLLRVLDLEDTSGVTNDDLGQIVEVFPRLKFLSVRGCEEVSLLPDSLGDMKQLHTLDIRGTNIVKLPKAITKLEKLQYIRAVTTKVQSDELGDDATSITPTMLVAEEATRAHLAAGEEEDLQAAAAAARVSKEDSSDNISSFPGTSRDRRSWRKRRSARDLGASSSWLSKLMRCSRHEHHEDYNAKRNNGGVELPTGVGKLTALRTIGVVNVGAGANGKAILKELKKLTQLRKLKVSGINSGNWHDLCGVISGHGHLESLSVWLDQQHEEDGEFACNFDVISKPPKSLKSLKVHGPGERSARIRQVWIQQLPNLQGVDVELTVSTQEDIESIYRACKQATGSRVSIHRVCIDLVQEQLDFVKPGSDLEGFSVPLDALRIVCSTTSQHSEVTFGSFIMFSVEVLQVHCCSSKSQHGCGSSSSLRLSGLDTIGNLKQVWLTGSYGEKVKQDLLGQLAHHPNRPVLMVEQPPSM